MKLDLVVLVLEVHRSVREFSTETTFVANSNSIVPTQKALKSYIENRFTGGGSQLVYKQLDSWSGYFNK